MSIGFFKGIDSDKLTVWVAIYSEIPKRYLRVILKWNNPDKNSEPQEMLLDQIIDYWELESIRLPFNSIMSHKLKTMYLEFVKALNENTPLEVRVIHPLSLFDEAAQITFSIDWRLDDERSLR